MNRIIRYYSSLLCIGIATLAMSSHAIGQGTTSVRGTVTDQTGAIIPDATLELTDPAIDVHKTTTSDNKGEYEFPQLQPSKYTIRASVAGMSTQERVVELLVAQPATINFALAISNATETVLVAADNAALNTTDATIGNAVDNNTVQSLPMEGRNAPDLLSLQPGVLFLGHAQQMTLVADEDSRSGSVAGARSDQGNVTLDGLDNNDQVTGLAFNGVLRSTLDSVEEFRVTTTGQNAESGRTSGAQVNVVTKQGTNAFHASAYEYNRNTFFAANDWFNKKTELLEHEANKPGELIRNTFGVAGGGPIKKDKVYFFTSFERQPTAENQQVIDTVPTAALRSGILHYTTSDAAGTNVVGAAGTGTYLAQLSAAQFAVLDPNCTTSCPWGHGEDPNSIALAQQFPLPNATGVGDGYNTSEFTWSAPNPLVLNTELIRVDYVLSDKNRLFFRGDLQDDGSLQPALFPTHGAAGFFSPVAQPSQDNHTDGTKGIAVGETWMISHSLINNVRFGYTRQSYSDQGPGKASYTTPTVIGLPFAITRTQQILVPVYNAVDDLNWVKRSHSFQFGVNYRNIQDQIATDAKSYSSASASSGENFDAISNTGQSLDPASPEGIAAGYAPVLSSFGSSYSSLSMGIAGVVASESIGYQYHNNRNGTASLLPTGSLVHRHFNANELEYYFQDQWRVTSKFTLTYGVRHTVLQTPYEVNGQQVQPTISLHQWFETRAAQAAKGVVDQPNFSFAPSGKANNAKPFYPMNWFNFSPRLGIAYALNSKTTIRVGAGLYFDHFGEALVRNFSELGSYGLGGSESTPAGFFSPDTAPRFTSITTLPTYPANILPPSLLPPPATTISYPYSPPSSGQAFAWAIDDKLKTPYSYAMNLDVQREVKGGYVLEGAYVGRIGRHLIVQRDLGMPLDLVDPQSGMDYFTAASLLETQAYAKVKTSAVAKIAYWEDLFPDAAGASGSPMASIPCPKTVCQAGNSATQNIYNQFAAQPLNATDDLNLMDTLCSPGCGSQLYRYYNGAFSSLYSDGTIGYSTYNAGQLTLRHAMTRHYQTDFSYTYSKAIDIGSDAERTCTSCTAVGTTADASTGVLINSFNPRQNKGVADFDTTHLITADAVYKLPFGKGEQFLNASNGVADAIFGGWQLNGLGRWSSGLPFGLQIAGGWMTAWPKQSMTIQTAPLGNLSPKKTIINGTPDAFPNPTALVAGITGLSTSSPLRYPLPGEVGERNKYRGDGFFDTDSGLMKTWQITESQSLKFDWEVFNVTNSVRFDCNPTTSLQNSVGKGSLGAYSRTLSVPRVQQFSLRYSF